MKPYRDGSGKIRYDDTLKEMLLHLAERNKGAQQPEWSYRQASDIIEANLERNGITKGLNKGNTREMWRSALMNEYVKMIRG